MLLEPLRQAASCRSEQVNKGLAQAPHLASLPRLAVSAGQVAIASAATAARAPGVAMAGPDLASCDDGLELAREGGSDATTHLSRRGTALIREAPTLNHRAPPSGRRARRHSFWVALLSSRPRQARTPADPFTAARDYSPTHSRQRQRERLPFISEASWVKNWVSAGLMTLLCSAFCGGPSK